MPAPLHETQVAEAANRELVQRQASGQRQPATAQELAVAADERASAAEVFDDPVRSDAPVVQPQPEPQERSERIEAPIDLRAQKRAEITARFRTTRNDDADDFSRSGTPEGFEHPVPDLAPVVDAESDPAADPEAQPQPAPEAPVVEPPKMKKVKVRGREYEISEDEYHAAAQKGLAGDDYLDEAKQRLNQADELYRDLQNRARHPGPTGEHHAGQEAVQPGQNDPQATEQPQHPEEDAIAKAIELIQYGDPEEAKQLLNSAIERKAAEVATGVVKNTLQTEKFQDEAARTAKVLKDFEDQHSDLAKDPRSRAAIRATVVELQRKDLEALGVDPSKLPTRTGQVSDDDIANAHRWYRTKGYNVRTPATLLENARDDFLAWRGLSPSATDDPPADPNPDATVPPRIEVRVDRNQRRQSIPQQPSRSAAPQREAMQQPAPQPRDRSSIVDSMKARNAKMRGSTLGA